MQYLPNLPPKHSTLFISQRMYSKRVRSLIRCCYSPNFQDDEDRVYTDRE